MACMLMAVLLVASYQLAPAHAAPPAPVPELAPGETAPVQTAPVQTAPAAALSNSIFQHLAAPAAARHSGTAISIRSAGEEAEAPAEEESALAPSAEEDVINPTNSSFGSKSSTLRLQRFYPSNCSSLAPYSSCWSGFKAAVAGGTLALTSTGASSCATGSGIFGGPDDSGDQSGFGTFSSGPPTDFGIGGGSGPAPDDSGNITGVGISAVDDRIIEGGCVAVYSVTAGGPFLGIKAVSSAAALKLAGWLVPLCTLLAVVAAL